MIWLTNLTTQYKLMFFATLFLAGLSSGVWIERLIVRSAEVAGLKAQIQLMSDQADAADKKNEALTNQHKADAQIISTANDTIQKQKNLIEASYDQTPANTGVFIAPVRVQLLNKERAAANGLRKR